jgi:UDP-3-O-[3-hydroxymyristoyl] N-acetylglucosamine deacetylase
LRYQQTINKPVTCFGVGLHCGKAANIKLLPAPVGTGIIFIRTDLPGWPSIKCSWENVVDTSLATTVGCNGAKVATVEHLLAALYGLGISNLRVEIDSDEVPILDGSAAEFVSLIRQAGYQPQLSPGIHLRVIKPVKISEGDREAALFPSDDFRMSLIIDYNHSLIGVQSYSDVISEVTFERDISRARTFGFLKEVVRLQAEGFAQGGSLDNSVVVGEREVLNLEGLRYPDEFVRHKVLDCVGDLSLLGFPLSAHYQAYKPGHSLNHKLLRLLLSSPDSYRVEDLSFQEPQLTEPAQVSPEDGASVWG